jgi:protein phosphatase
MRIATVHSCYEELSTLLGQLGYKIENGPDGPTATPPDGRKAVFVGDLVDRGPKIPDVLRLVMRMVDEGEALCVPGNHDMKLMRKLKGRDVQMTHGLADSVQQLDKESPEFKQAVIKFLDDLVSHYVFDDGKLVVRPRGHEGGNAGAWIGQGTRFCSLRRDNGRDGRLRTPRALQLGCRISRHGHGRLREYAHCRARMAKPHDQRPRIQVVLGTVVSASNLC